MTDKGKTYSHKELIFFSFLISYAGKKLCYRRKEKFLIETKTTLKARLMGEKTVPKKSELRTGNVRVRKVRNIYFLKF